MYTRVRYDNVYNKLRFFVLTLYYDSPFYSFRVHFAWFFYFLLFFFFFVLHWPSFTLHIDLDLLYTYGYLRTDNRSIDDCVFNYIFYRIKRIVYIIQDITVISYYYMYQRISGKGRVVGVLFSGNQSNKIYFRVWPNSFILIGFTVLCRVTVWDHW